MHSDFCDWDDTPTLSSLRATAVVRLVPQVTLIAGAGVNVAVANAGGDLDLGVGLPSTSATTTRRPSASTGLRAGATACRIFTPTANPSPVGITVARHFPLRASTSWTVCIAWDLRRRGRRRVRRARWPKEGVGEEGRVQRARFSAGPGG